MLSDYNSAISRIQQLESRIQALENSVAPPHIPAAPTSAMQSAPVSAPQFSSMLNGMTTPSSSLLTKFSPYIDGIITKYANQYNVSPNLVRAVITQESSGNVMEHSSKGAMGLMQLMPSEASTLGITDPYNPEQNIAGGTKLLSSLLQRFQGDVPLALAAYNAGPGAVEKYNGVPPYPETQHYVQRILQMMNH